MENLHSDNGTADRRIKKIGYVVICYVLRELIVSGMRIALAGELKSIKMLVDPTNIDPWDDMDLLRTLKEPHIQLASELADHVQFDVLDTYGMLNLMDDYDVLEDKWAMEMGEKLFWRYVFWRSKPRVRDRYVNFSRVLLTAQRALFELLKLMLTMETRAFGPNYRSNYSDGRLKALMKGEEDRTAVIITDLIRILKVAHAQCLDLMAK